MILSKEKLLVGLLITLALGIATGYLFSSKFCSVTIGKRVEKISTLNQMLRKLFALNTFYVFQDRQAQELKTSNQETISAHLSKTNEEIANILGTYYDKQATDTFKQWLNKQINLNEFIAFLSQLNPTWSSSMNSIKANLEIQGDLSNKIQDAIRHKNWQQAYDHFEQNLTHAMDFADELDKGITQQFPHKF